MKTDRAALYEKLARTCCDAAYDESRPPELRAYYAKLALWADKRAAKFQNERGSQ